jgi:hypothetical protein
MPVLSADKSVSLQGLVSIDRSEVAALLSTTPRPGPRSSTNDLASPLRWVGFTPHMSQAEGSSLPWRKDSFLWLYKYAIGPEGSSIAVLLPPVGAGSQSTVTLPGGIPA